MKERHLKILSIFVVLAALLIQYQNCGTKGGQATDSEGFSQNLNQDPEMGIINPVETGAIQFIQSKSELQEIDSQLIAYGMCSSEQQGAQLSWKLFDAEQNLVSSGKSLCDRGAFEVVYTDAKSLDCNSNLILSAYFGSKQKTDLMIEKICN